MSAYFKADSTDKPAIYTALFCPFFPTLIGAIPSATLCPNRYSIRTTYKCSFCALVDADDPAIQSPLMSADIDPNGTNGTADEQSHTAHGKTYQYAVTAAKRPAIRDAH